MTPELQAKIVSWRRAAVDGTLTQEQMIEAIAALRAGRKSAAIASDTARTKAAKAAIPNADDLLAELKGL